MNAESAPSTQLTAVPTPNILISLMEKLQQLLHQCEQAKCTEDDERLRDVVHRQVGQLLQQIHNLDRSDDPSNSTNWQPQLTRMLATNTHDAVLKCFVIGCLEPGTMTAYYPPNLITEYARQYKSYNLVFGELLPQPLRQKRWEMACIDYNDDRGNSASDDWHAYRQNLLRRQQRPSELIGIATGISQLDNALGGLHGLTFLGGDKGIGKTSLATTMAVAALRSDLELSVLFYSLDIKKTRIYDRLICHTAGITYRELHSTEDEIRRRIDTASDALAHDILPRLIVRHRCQLGENGSFASVLQADLQTLIRQTGAKRVLVVIDSLRKIPVPIDTTSNEDPDIIRLQAIEHFSSNPNFAFLVIAEIRKSDGASREPVLDDLRGSASLGYAADNVLLMWQSGEQRDREVVPVMLRIAKGRDGVERREVAIGFDHVHYRFIDGAPSVRRSSTLSHVSSADPLAGRTGGRSA